MDIETRIDRIVEYKLTTMHKTGTVPFATLRSLLEESLKGPLSRVDHFEAGVIVIDSIYRVKRKNEVLKEYISGIIDQSSLSSLHWRLKMLSRNQYYAADKQVIVEDIEYAESQTAGSINAELQGYLEKIGHAVTRFQDLVDEEVSPASSEIIDLEEEYFLDEEEDYELESLVDGISGFDERELSPPPDDDPYLDFMDWAGEAPGEFD
jgi:hypothetical protein